MSLFLGAYATSPCGSAWDAAAEAAYWDGLCRLPALRGLEYPFTGMLHPHDEAWALAHLDPAWDLVLTLLPGTMDRLAVNPTFGLASDNPAGRRAALDFTQKASEIVARFNDAAGRRRVVAVEMHSAPRRGQPNVTASAQSLTQSLMEIAQWDWQGAALCLEHCDAYSASLPPIKGFLTFEEEIAAIRESGTEFGVSINWGRSVLEARDVCRPLEQITQARQAGLLRGLIFSGCSDQSTPWGVWQDSHMPHAPSQGTAYAAPGSLMTEQAIAAALSAAGEDLVFLGGKLTARPDTADLETRLGLNRDLLHVITTAQV